MDLFCRSFSPPDNPDPAGAEAQRLGLAADVNAALAGRLVRGDDLARYIGVVSVRTTFQRCLSSLLCHDSSFTHFSFTESRSSCQTIVVNRVGLRRSRRRDEPAQLTRRGPRVNAIRRRSKRG
jgi:hypothetical protein